MFSDTDITEFIRVQREKINSQKRYYEDFVDRLSKVMDLVFMFNFSGFFGNLTAYHPKDYYF